MDNLFSGIIGSIKFLFKAIRLFWKGPVGIYFLLFKAGFDELKKYTLLLLAFLSFYVIGINIDKAGFILHYEIIPQSYNRFINDLSSDSSIKDNFKVLLSIIILLEASAFVLAKPGNRAFLSRYNFLLATWTFLFISFLALIAAVLTTLMHMLEIGEGGRDFIAGLIVICSLVFIIGIFVSPHGALSIARKRGLISESLEGLGAVLNFAIPVAIFFLLKGVLGAKEIENKVYFLGGDKQKLNLMVNRDNMIRYSIETSMIVESGYAGNYILDPDSENYMLYWYIVDEDNNRLNYSDSVMLKSTSAGEIAFLPNMPIRVSLKGALSPGQYRKLKYVADSTDEKKIHLALKTINIGKVHLSYTRFTISLTGVLDKLMEVGKKMKNSKLSD